jgi:dimeric dUTPase (all-alpha-NTP-PPase superfamily)
LTLFREENRVARTPHPPERESLNMNQVNSDMLASIFRMQTELNDYVFHKNNLKDKQGNTLNMHSIFTAVERGELMVNDLPNTWLSNYTRAMNEELKELDADLLWKWWSKDKIDIQNIRVELIDILHFLISAMLAAGLTAERVFEVYQQKHAVNLNRQDTGYSKATKTDDNRGII